MLYRGGIVQPCRQRLLCWNILTPPDAVELDTWCSTREKNGPTSQRTCKTSPILAGGREHPNLKCPYNCQDKSLDDVARKSFCLEKLSDGTLRLKYDHSYYYQCQIFTTKREFYEFVVWSNNELHVKWLTLDKDLMVSSILIAEKFWKLCGSGLPASNCLIVM